MAFNQYRLRSELQGHQEDVRALCACELGLWTASRDKTVKLWTEVDQRHFALSSTLVGHTSFVGSIAYSAELRQQSPQGFLLSGSQDTTAILWDVATAAEFQRLEGHKYQISAVAFGPGGVLYSASVDSTVRVWRDGKAEAVLEHGSPVQCLLVLPNGDVLSGCSDGSVRLWQGNKLVQTFTGHSDTVRGLALLPGLGMVSASHDQTLRLWDFSGSCMAEFVGHTAIVYSAAGSDKGLVASASEDNTARLWRPDGSCLQSITHPACVWAVTFLANEDLATACADYTARVFSSSADRVAPEAEQEAFQSQAASLKQDRGGQQQAAELPAGLHIEDASVLAQPGKKSGEIKVIREGGAGVAYSWDAGKGEWDRIGDVVGGPGSDDNTMAVSSKMHQGQQYDFVFDVDIEDGAPPKKLPFNCGGNPYDAADRFLEAENLPVSYREQIVDFIIRNSGGGAAMPAVPSVNVDPFTGSAAYMPSGIHASSAGGHPQATVTGGGYDPFTGASARQPAYPASMPQQHHQPLARLIPQQTLTIFNTPLKAAAVSAKVKEFSSQLSAGPDSGALVLSESELAVNGTLESLVAKVCQPPSVVLTEAELSLLAKLLRWPAPRLFPALDIARLAVLHDSIQSHLAANAGPLEMSPLGSLGAAIAAAAEEPQSPANQQTALRLLSNACQGQHLSSWLLSHAQAIVDAWAPAFTTSASQPKAVRGASAAMLGNLAVLTHPGRHHAPANSAVAAHDQSATAHLDEGFYAQLLSALAELIQNAPAEDADAIFRTLVAAGTIAHSSPSALSLARDLDLAQAASRVKAAASSAHVRQAADEMAELLSHV